MLREKWRKLKAKAKEKPMLGAFIISGVVIVAYILMWVITFVGLRNNRIIRIVSYDDFPQIVAHTVTDEINTRPWLTELYESRQYAEIMPPEIIVCDSSWFVFAYGNIQVGDIGYKYFIIAERIPLTSSYVIRRNSTAIFSDTSPTNIYTFKGRPLYLHWRANIYFYLEEQTVTTHFEIVWTSIFIPLAIFAPRFVVALIQSNKRKNQQNIIKGCGQCVRTP